MDIYERGDPDIFELTFWSKITNHELLDSKLRMTKLWPNCLNSGIWNYKFKMIGEFP